MLSDDDEYEYRAPTPEEERRYREHMAARCDKISPEQFEEKIRGLCLFRLKSWSDDVWAWTVGRECIPC